MGERDGERDGERGREREITYVYTHTRKINQKTHIIMTYTICLNTD